MLVGALSEDREAFYGGILAPYLNSPDTFFVISSDFCHWQVQNSVLHYQNQHLFLIRGTRFSYTYYYPEPAPSVTPGIQLSRSKAPSAAHPIHESISRLDHEAIDLLTLPPSTATNAHGQFAQYLSRTKNTICGRHPIGVLLGALSSLEKSNNGIQPTVKWVRYEQSSQCHTIRDSSVSYASAYVRF